MLAPPSFTDIVGDNTITRQDEDEDEDEDKDKDNYRTKAKN